ncbi:MAG: S-layer homology domain-containing protein [Phormidesmis sp.]
MHLPQLLLTRTLLTVAALTPLTFSALSPPRGLAQGSAQQGTRDYQFGDAANYWAAACIEGAGGEGLMKGYLDGRFRPEGTMTRAEFAAVMIKAFPTATKVREAPDFLDVARDFWGRGAIAAAYERGFLTGYPDNTFKPAQPISRAQAIIVIANAQGLSPTDESEAILRRYFEDDGEIPNYAKGAIAAATQQQLVVNYPNIQRLRPNANITRGEATALLCRTNAAGSDARYYVPAQYVAAFGNGTEASEKLEPILLKEFSQQSSSGLLYATATLPEPTPAVDYTALKQLFFSANDGQNGEELWITDGTPAGTRLFLDVAPGLDDSGQPKSSAPQFVGFADERFWFATDQRQTPEALTNALWSSDGTVEGTGAIASISPSLSQALSKAESLTAYPNYLFKGRFPFMVTTQTSHQLWLSDGVSEAGTQRLADFPHPSGSEQSPVYEFTSTSDTLFFLAPVADRLPELWRSDGTPVGTQLLKAIAPPQADFTTWKDRIFLTAGTPTEGLELWTSDGTSEGTILLKDIYSGNDSALPIPMAGIGSSFLFLARDTNGLALWETQGTPTSTRRVKQLGEGAFYSSATPFKVHQNKLYFGVLGFKEIGVGDSRSSIQIAELWITDGTESGTKRLKEFSPGGIQEFTLFKDRLFFNGGGPNGQELWTSDGTAEGTHQVLDLAPGTTTVFPPCPAPPPELDQPGYCAPETAVNSASPTRLTVRGDFLYFFANGDELFRTDGTGKGMQQIKTLNRQDGTYLPAIASIDTALLFTGYNKNTGQPQLWALPD